MTFLPDVSGPSLEKLFNNHWIRFFYNEPTETWQEKYRSLISEWWNQSTIFIESKARQFFPHWHIYVVFITGTLVVLTIYKSRKYLGTIKLREKFNPAIRTEEQTCSADEETVIVSEDYNEDDGEHRDETSVKLCPTFRSDLDDPTTQRNNDHLEYRTESSISSEITIVPGDFQHETNNFLKNLIDSITPGQDSIDSSDSLDLRESILEKVDSQNRKKFYVLTPWVDELEEECFSEKSHDAKLKTKLIELSHLEPSLKENVTSDENDSMPNAIQEHSDHLEEIGQKPISSNSRESNFHDNALPTLEDFVKKSLESSATNGNEKSEKFHVTNDMTESALFMDDSKKPRSRNSRRTIEINNEESIDVSGSEIRADSKHRFRSLSHDDRPVSSSVNLDPRRGGSVSPPLRNKNKQRPTKQGQSRIPTLSPPSFMSDRALQHYETIDGSISEASNQIRSALLRKLREVWEQHPQDSSQLSNRLRNSSLSNGSPIDSKLLELGSRIPLPRKFPRGRPFQ